MKSNDFDAVTYQGEVYCWDHLPDGVTLKNEEVNPIFADSEWDYYPVCCHCGIVHDYVSLLPQDVT
jgi:hypothetical protein